MEKQAVYSMTEGSPAKLLLKFTLPMLIGNLFQQFYNMVDAVVVGRFVGSNALAAVGATGSLNFLFFSLSFGISAGVGVVVSQYFGAGKKKELKQTVHTSITISLISGIILTFIGVFGSKLILQMMKAPEVVLNLANIYLKIYFAGITSTMVYNFGSALLRAKGDTKRPLYILLLSGVINLILNLVFVINFKMDVSGVAWATVISQTLSAVLVILILIFEKDDFHLEIKKLCINPVILKKIVKIGLPAGFQGIMFSFSNVIIQSSVNMFGPVVIAGNSAAINLEGFIYTSMNGFSQGSLTFCSQNLGAKKIERIKKVVIISQFSILG